MSQSKFVYDFVEKVWVVEQLDNLLRTLKSLDDAGFEISSDFLPDRLEFGLKPKHYDPTVSKQLNPGQHAGVLDKNVDELELSTRSYNCLLNADIRTVRELVQRTEADLLKTKNFGRKQLNEVKETLHTMGLTLGMKLDSA